MKPILGYLSKDEKDTIVCCWKSLGSIDYDPPNEIILSLISTLDKVCNLEELSETRFPYSGPICVERLLKYRNEMHK